MKKSDLIIVGLLVLFLIAWINWFPVSPPARSPQKPLKEERKTQGQEKEFTAPSEVSLKAPPEVVPEAPVPEERIHILTNNFLTLQCSSLGATIKKAILNNYPKTLTNKYELVDLDFSKYPSLAFKNFPGFGIGSAFNVSGNFTQLAFNASRDDGLQLDRQIKLEKNYIINVQEVFRNKGQQIIKVEKHSLQLGRMEKLPNVYSVGVTLGLDALLHYSGKVKHYGSDLSKWAKKSPGFQVDRIEEQPLDWAAVKNKFFTHLLTFKRGELESPSGLRLTGKYDKNIKQLKEAGVELLFDEIIIEPGQQFSRQMEYYIGPKKYDILKKLPDKQAEVMEFGIWKPVSRILLTVLNFFHDTVWPYNYGLAIILLTLTVRIVFWPLTHKSTESMKKMQALAPEMKALKEKFKDNPQKQQKATMELYKKNKVNPLSGCLPMLVQFPVFIALFFVLRSAIELRFAGFLWIDDLSEPERLLDLKALLPFPFVINLLPFVMSGTMFIQQKLTPSTGDATQQKIMQFFPLILLFFLYNMPSGLLLYWSTSNVLMIIQQMLNLKKQKKEKTAS